MSSDQRRASLRLPIKMKVRVSTDTICTRHLITDDFSDGGIFVIDEMLAKLTVGTLVKVQSDEGMDDAPILDARIAWTNSRGAGLEYLLD